VRKLNLHPIAHFPFPSDSFIGLWQFHFTTHTPTFSHCARPLEGISVTLQGPYKTHFTYWHFTRSHSMCLLVWSHNLWSVNSQPLCPFGRYSPRTFGFKLPRLSSADVPYPSSGFCPWPRRVFPPVVYFTVAPSVFSSPRLNSSPSCRYSTPSCSVPPPKACPEWANALALLQPKSIGSSPVTFDLSPAATHVKTNISSTPLRWAETKGGG
jgi:hypothetical protein